MPPVIARELLEGTPLEALARSYASATIAFVALEEYSTKVGTARVLHYCLHQLETLM